MHRQRKIGRPGLPHPTSMKHMIHFNRLAISCLPLLLCISLNANADRGSALPAHVPAVYLQECASCHIAYPPGMLNPSSWQRIMGGLSKHYGTDAALESKPLQSISSWLNANAGTYKRVTEAPPEDRITKSPWFERKHQKIDSSVWKLPSVKSAANCSACHRQAESGHFSDHDLVIPAGVPASQQRAWRD